MPQGRHRSLDFDARETVLAVAPTGAALRPASVPYREEGRHARHDDHDQRPTARRPLRAGPQPPWLCRRSLGRVGADKDFATAARLGLEFGEDFELLEDIGWGEDEGRESFELTMPVHDLTELLKRLHDEAEQVLRQGAEAHSTGGGHLDGDARQSRRAASHRDRPPGARGPGAIAPPPASLAARR